MALARGRKRKSKE